MTLLPYRSLPVTRSLHARDSLHALFYLLRYAYFLSPINYLMIRFSYLMIRFSYLNRVLLLETVRSFTNPNGETDQRR